MRIVTHNINGIRAALKRGFITWLDQSNSDLVALQEVRCRVKDLPENPFGDYFAYYDPGELAGRNGVAILVKEKPELIRTLSGEAVSIIDGIIDNSFNLETIDCPELQPYAKEGRYIEIDLSNAPLRIASLYLPKGAVPEHWAKKPEDIDQPKYERKMAFMTGLEKLVSASKAAAKSQGREFLITGDFNIAHTEQDLKNWKTNQRSEGFLPEEREWLTGFLKNQDLIDTMRILHPDENGPYSWWSWRGQAFTNDTGWRIDYQLASETLSKAATTSWVGRANDYDSRVSDHAPVFVDYEL